MTIGQYIVLSRVARVAPGSHEARSLQAFLRASLRAGVVALACAAFVGLSSGAARAGGLECPEISAAVPNLLADAPQLGRLTTANTVDLADEINGLIARVKTEKPGISNDEITDVLLAAFCPVVAAKTDLSSAEKWRLMHRLDTVAMQQIQASTMPAGSQIIASVPLPPDVFRDLSNKAETAGQQPTQFMANILKKAVGK
jgi:hypothetical protein